ncbi:uncharacterized protein EI90DRAFT_3059273 [Cantharellus anzutake]|uniref:uncharacterized protein n=1 Tax=Cantharellus anzutake TaxID=1750568 RepID=UPI001905D083|nr:uncharacterized protein EI90DRAFT_3059273 [Cantharellus anzutake]KAF8330790.1 hypothetical protein EI90DRAFT_3059273 [Cantharellus anzutake]
MKILASVPDEEAQDSGSLHPQTLRPPQMGVAQRTKLPKKGAVWLPSPLDLWPLGCEPWQ